MYINITSTQKCLEIRKQIILNFHCFKFIKTLEYTFSPLKAYKMFGEDQYSYHSQKAVLAFCLISVVLSRKWNVVSFLVLIVKQWEGLDYRDVSQKLWWGFHEKKILSVEYGIWKRVAFPHFRFAINYICSWWVCSGLWIIRNYHFMVYKIQQKKNNKRKF